MRYHIILQVRFVHVSEKGESSIASHVLHYPTGSTLRDRGREWMREGSPLRADREGFALHFSVVIQSSTVNLLGRLFDATDGEILVDDMPISKFKTKELRLAQAMLYQDFVKYPTSVSKVRSMARWQV